MLGAWLCQLALSLIGFSWAAFAIREFTELSYFESLLLFLAFAGFASLHIPLAMLCWLPLQRQLKKWGAGRGPILLLLPLLSALSFAHCPMIFDWHFGYVWLYAGWPAAHTAEIYGFEFLNTVTLFFNLLFLIVFQSLCRSCLGFQVFSHGGRVSRERARETVLRGIPPPAVLTPAPAGAGGYMRRAMAVPERQPSLHERLKEISCADFSNQTGIKKAISRKGKSLPQEKTGEKTGKKTREKNQGKKARAFWAFGLWLLAFAALNVCGAFLKSRRPEPDRLARALVLQPNISNQKQKHKESRLEVLEQILKDTRKALKKFPGADFILWPEGGYPYPIDKAKAAKGKDPIQKWAAAFSVPLAVSAEGKTAPPEGKTAPETSSNSVFVFDSKGRLIQGAYDKAMLLPFVEYAPWGGRLPGFRRLFLGSRPFAAGRGANRAVRLNGLNIGIQICYEGLSARLSRLAALEGADILLNSTNDGWFGAWQEPWQHLYMTLARSVETGLPLIRGANSGFSAVISAKGDISGPAPFAAEALNQKLAWLAEIPYSSKKKRTVFVSGGHHINQWLLWLLLAALVLPRLRMMMGRPRAAFRSVFSRLISALRRGG